MATQVGPISPQAQGNFPNGEWGEPGRSFTMDNNCLNLNVWTPNLTDGKKRPVMVWLHGGGFEAAERKVLKPVLPWSHPLMTAPTSAVAVMWSLFP